ncbi:MAG TPA: tetratricopeptide repeat protein [Candidatus Limnocylindrales bacterium]|nr:tetratricopeptide repeat protein [Candidatus Limnocylindrales bacterium]
MFRLAVAALACISLSAQEPQTTDLDAAVKTANAAYLKGDYEAARQSFLQAWDQLQQTPPDNPQRYDILKRLVSVRAAAGEFEDANNYLQMAINWREQTSGPSDPKIADDLLQSVSLFRGLKQFDQALVVMNRVLTLHAHGPAGFESTDIADDYSRIAQIQMEKKDLASGITFFTRALQIRTKLFGPLDPSLVYDLDRVGAAYTASRDYPNAEAAFRHALVIRESLYGKNHADLISTVDGLAYACFGQKKFDDAEPIYTRLVELWKTSVGKDHPMVALALDKVSVFYIAQKKFDQAKDAADQANAIRARFLAEGLSEQATEQFSEGNKEDTVALYQRALKAMDPPNPVYDDLHKEIEDMLKTIAPMSSKALIKKTAAPPRKK